METKVSSFAKFTRGYTFKVLLLFLLVLLLLIPLMMIRGLISDRNMTAQTAESDIMEAWGKQLVEGGPVIAIPGIRTSEQHTKTERGETVGIVKTPFTLTMVPEKMEIEAHFITEIRRRGIFSVPLFAGELRLFGRVDPAVALASLLPNEEVFFDQAELVIVLSSQKGIRTINRALWNGKDLFFQPGSRGQDIIDTRRSAAGIYALLPAFSESPSDFDIAITIQGGNFVRFLPVAQDTHVRISADWASPSFQGSFLPSTSAITSSGFEAVWDINYLSRDIPLAWKNGAEALERDYGPSLFGVDFFRSIDTYALNTRAVKYAVLFLIVPFLTLFLLEVFTKKPIHPVPYLLSGIGNVIFYLLLLSLSEQMQFYLAYLAAAGAVSLMMTLYSRSLLPSWNKSWYMGLVVVLCYVMLYAVLNAESYALLIGSTGAFAVVALVMFLTSKLDWYGREL